MPSTPLRPHISKKLLISFKGTCYFENKFMTFERRKTSSGEWWDQMLCIRMFIKLLFIQNNPSGQQWEGEINFSLSIERNTMISWLLNEIGNFPLFNVSFKRMQNCTDGKILILF